ncbi:MAG: hypothetical protein M3O30_05555 [Planctomycetota bacterium]|nr:hypothetical protein [Planctomycetota bacterium]
MLNTEIIQQLNECNVHSTGFPRLWGFYFLVDVRLSAYRNDLSWALGIEMLIFNNYGQEGHLACQTMVFCYGDDLPQSPGIAYPALCATGDGVSGPLFDPEDITQLLISPNVTDMTLRGKLVPIPTDPTKYTEAGILLKQPPRILGYELLRLIAPSYRRMFFATEAEIVRRIGYEMPLLLRLNEWRHPDWDKGETPADSESFQMIADVIAHNDPSLYQPTEQPNTHWSNWPMAGML